MKKILVISSLLLSITMISCGSHKNTKEQHSDQLVGGWSKCEIDSNVHKVVQFTLKEMKTKEDLKEIISAKSQIVSGRNFDVIFELENGEQWEVIVYVNLNDEYSITELKKK